MFYPFGHSSAGNEDGSDRVPGFRVLQNVDVPWDAPGSSECRFRILRSYLREGVSVAKIVRPYLRPWIDWAANSTTASWQQRPSGASE